ncbi:hypothetical protein [Mesorhizobium sp.]|uniref:hypothetical protein n=1 Tax=Mesorhizobium sp. TaxID=1871066 RepID=UPI0011FEA69E|nr:hypothetical protein [Mesorhizobium sp.]TIP72175.1 MAG: hypothetical protein E5X55_19390 [Mesorhizobium sp.]TJV96454.1 MAG: hypothetical protein E5X52_18695 [Mesorhizobium sp.]
MRILGMFLLLALSGPASAAVYLSDNANAAADVWVIVTDNPGAVDCWLLRSDITSVPSPGDVWAQITDAPAAADKWITITDNPAAADPIECLLRKD